MACTRVDCQSKVFAMLGPKAYKDATCDRFTSSSLRLGQPSGEQSNARPAQSQDCSIPCKRPSLGCGKTHQVGFNRLSLLNTVSVMTLTTGTTMLASTVEVAHHVLSQLDNINCYNSYSHTNNDSRLPAPLGA